METEIIGCGSSKGAAPSSVRSISCISRVTRSASARSSGRCLSSSAPNPSSISSACARRASDQQWQDAAHSLKGSAQAIGAWRAAAAAAERAEALSGAVLRRGAPGALLRELEASVDEAEAYIRSLL